LTVSAAAVVGILVAVVTGFIRGTAYGFIPAIIAFHARLTDGANVLSVPHGTGLVTTVPVIGVAIVANFTWIPHAIPADNRGHAGLARIVTLKIQILMAIPGAAVSPDLVAVVAVFPVIRI
jgi:hypothetical protein